MHHFSCLGKTTTKWNMTHVVKSHFGKGILGLSSLLSPYYFPPKTPSLYDNIPSGEHKNITLPSTSKTKRYSLCVAHRCFNGRTKSKVTCGTCGRVYLPNVSAQSVFCDTQNTEVKQSAWRTNMRMDND